MYHSMWLFMEATEALFVVFILFLKLKIGVQTLSTFKTDRQFV